MEDRSSFHALDSNNSFNGRVQWCSIPVLSSGVVHCPLCQEHNLAQPIYLGKKEKVETRPPAGVFYSKHYFCWYQGCLNSCLHFMFNHNKNGLNFSFNFSLVYAWNFDLHSLHSCGIFPNHTGSKGFALSYLFSAEPQGKNNAILFQTGSKQGTKQWSKTSLFTF